MKVEEIIKRVQSSLDIHAEITDAVVSKSINDVIKLEPDFHKMTLERKRTTFDYIFNAIRKLDILQPLIDDPSITEIMVNGTESIFIEKAGKIIKTELKFKSAERLNYLVQKIVSAVNRSVNTANPIVDARLRDGSRVNVVLPPVALNGPIITIRKFRNENFTFEDLVEMGAITKEACDFLKNCIKERKNIFVSGGTGSGKTTFLNILSRFIDKSQRIITIEDSAELKLDNIPNWVRLETRNANGEGVGEITIKGLIKTALRMRPDRIIVGEVRGDEAIDMLQAMNTGHDGSLSTGHANSIEDMLRRLEIMVYSAKDMPLESIRQQIGSAIDVIVYLSRMKDGSRKVTEIKTLSSYKEGKYQLFEQYSLSKLDNNLSKQRELLQEAIQ